MFLTIITVNKQLLSSGGDDRVSITSEQIVLVNIIEDFVKREVKETITHLGACKCETCYFNACALALNAIEPKYVTSSQGALLTEVTETEIGNKTKIIVEVTKAVLKVMEFPHHN